MPKMIKIKSLSSKPMTRAQLQDVLDDQRFRVEQLMSEHERLVAKIKTLESASARQLEADLANRDAANALLEGLESELEANHNEIARLEALVAAKEEDLKAARADYEW